MLGTFLLSWISGVLLTAIFFLVLWIVALLFLWHGYKLFREMRVRLAMASVCTKCGREVLVPGARYCGKCGGQLVRAA